MDASESYIRDPEKTAALIGSWMASQVERAGARGIVVGLSGGIDSAVAAAIGARALKKDGVLGVIMPCRSDAADAADALRIAGHLKIPHETVDLTETFGVMTAAIGAVLPLSEMARSNLKARLRMATLYGAAQSASRLVCGTGNRSEWEMGYFTKYGDAGSDLLPLLDLLKCEVRAVARHLGLPDFVLARVPTAGLWQGQTDEQEMGFTYDELDRYLATGEAAPETARKIEALRAKSEHKRLPVPACKVVF